MSDRQEFSLKYYSEEDFSALFLEIHGKQDGEVINYSTVVDRPGTGETGAGPASTGSSYTGYTGDYSSILPAVIQRKTKALCRAKRDNSLVCFADFACLREFLESLKGTPCREFREALKKRISQDQFSLACRLE